MHRAMSSFGFVSLAFFALATIGCIAETTEPSSLIWYDDELGACFTEDKDGNAVEVPCDGLDDLKGPEGGPEGDPEPPPNGTGCTGDNCCDVIDGQPVCP